MTVTESIKEAVGLAHGHGHGHTAAAARTYCPIPPSTRRQRYRQRITHELGSLRIVDGSADSKTLTTRTAATRQEMSDARLPLAYRDSCASLLIPLNKCRVQNYYMPWTCVVCSRISWKRARITCEEDVGTRGDNEVDNLGRMETD